MIFGELQKEICSSKGLSIPDSLVNSDTHLHYEGNLYIFAFEYTDTEERLHIVKLLDGAIIISQCYTVIGSSKEFWDSIYTPSLDRFRKYVEDFVYTPKGYNELVKCIKKFIRMKAELNCTDTIIDPDNFAIIKQVIEGNIPKEFTIGLIEKESIVLYKDLIPIFAYEIQELTTLNELLAIIRVKVNNYKSF